MCIPRRDAIWLAGAEEKALWARAEVGGRCADTWRETAQAAQNVGRHLRRGDDLAALNQVYAVTDGWKAAARCLGVPCPLGQPEPAPTVPRAVWVGAAVGALLALLS